MLSAVPSLALTHIWLCWAHSPTCGWLRDVGIINGIVQNIYIHWMLLGGPHNHCCGNDNLHMLYNSTQYTVNNCSTVIYCWNKAKIKNCPFTMNNSGTQSIHLFVISQFTVLGRVSLKVKHSHLWVTDFCWYHEASHWIIVLLCVVQ